uniref:Small ribosomal subunit protein bS18c n=1 Tax=Microrhizoidea pickettheapsiorum TaxID=2604950 RepID=A0A5B9RKC7_9CHLO|nr:ribosomal protein S18 [Microrhizoidea pickettheapsiorum]QEG77719.1 ribosomal protein S18 [Microrhizoidea pickettheapsiorum]
MDYKNIDLLQQFISEQGKILPRRVTGLSTKEQRVMKKAVKQARIMGLIYFSLNFRGNSSIKKNI